MALGPGTSAPTPTAAGPPRVPARVTTVRAQFHARARRFPSHDALVREVRGRLVDRLQYIRLAPRRVLDVGCGAGGAIGALAARYPSAVVAGLDSRNREAIIEPAAAWTRHINEIRDNAGGPSSLLRREMERIPTPLR